MRYRFALLCPHPGLHEIFRTTLILSTSLLSESRNSRRELPALSRRSKLANAPRENSGSTGRRTEWDLSPYARYGAPLARTRATREPITVARRMYRCIYFHLLPLGKHPSMAYEKKGGDSPTGPWPCTEGKLGEGCRSSGPRGGPLGGHLSGRSWRWTLSAISEMSQRTSHSLMRLGVIAACPDGRWLVTRAPMGTVRSCDLVLKATAPG